MIWEPSPLEVRMGTKNPPAVENSAKGKASSITAKTEPMTTTRSIKAKAMSSESMA